MAKRITQESGYYLRLGAEYLNKTILPDSHNQTQIRRYKSTISRSAFVHFMFDESATIDGGRIAIGLLKNQFTLDNAESCTFKIYKVSNDATPWNDTLIKNGSISINSNKLFLTTLTSSEAGVDISGDVTFKIKAKIIKNNIPYYVSEYFNHLGITDTVQRIKKKVSFLEITKRDFGA